MTRPIDTARSWRAVAVEGREGKAARETEENGISESVQLEGGCACGPCATG